MSEYYAVTRSDEYLAHYGIKGMRWGVRKAIESHNERRLDRQYQKAVKKLAKLEARANIGKQVERVAKFNKVAKKAGKIGVAGAGLAVAGTGANHTLHYINGLHKQITENKLKDIDAQMARRSDDTMRMLGHYNSELHKGKISEAEHNKITDQIMSDSNDDLNKIDSDWYKTKDDFNKAKNTRKTAADIGKYVGYAGAAAGLAGLGTAAVAKAKAHAAKKRTTAEGHAKAVAERDAWKKEMAKAFKGTKYAKMRHTDLEDPNSLAHYGIKGMKWGVRRARYYKNDKALERHYRKAAKHLAKLEDIGNNPAKYAAKSLAYGVAAIGTGTTVAKTKDYHNRMEKFAKGGGSAHSFGGGAESSFKANDKKALAIANKALSEISKRNATLNRIVGIGSNVGMVGLGALSGVNAYRAINSRKYRDKANDFRKAIKETFKGTPYEGLNGLPLPPKRKKRR